jgi:hypothetical protein
LPANVAATEPADFHQPQVQNICGCFFATVHFEDLTFCEPDVSDVLKLDVLKPDVLKPDVLWVYLFFVGIFKATKEKSRIRSRNPVVQIRGSGSVLKRHGS